MLTTKILLQHNDTYWVRVEHSAFATKWRIRFGWSLVMFGGKELHLRVARRSVVALQEEIV